MRPPIAEEGVLSSSDESKGEEARCRAPGV